MDTPEDAQPTLPKDLLDRGFKLIVRAPDRMFAVSQSRGGTGTKATIGEVIREARAIAEWIEWMDQRKGVHHAATGD